MSEKNQIVPVMIGTAGHVDHGKTSLVKNLTGFDTDRLQEEKARGMTIDMGVAPLQLSSGKTLGIIDVPGHEDFIRNMVAGASSIDILMLVIAADDIVMPQTEEHLRIAKLLGISKLFVVVTKKDLVSAELMSLIDLEINEFLAKYGYRQTPIFHISNLTLEGIPEIKLYLEKIVEEIQRTPDYRAFRMDARLIFTMKGHGTVITGIPCSGHVSAGMELEILPGRRLTAVRSLQNYRSERPESDAHISCALNVRDVDPTSMKRGMTVAAPGFYEAVTEILVSFDNNSTLQLPKRSTVRFHAGTSVVTAKARIIADDFLAPGTSGFISLRLWEPVTLSAGDRFVLRQLSPALTIGGGQILSVSPGRRRKANEEFLALLIQAKEALSAQDYFGAELFVNAQAIYDKDSLFHLTRSPSEDANRLVGEKLEQGVLRKLDSNHYLVVMRLPELRVRLEKVLDRYHLLNKYVWGMKTDYAAELLHSPPSAIQALLPLLMEGTNLTLKHGRLARQDFAPQISAKEIKLREDVLKLITQAGITSVARGPLLEQLAMSEKELRQITKLLADEGLIVLLGNNYLLRAVYEDCKEKLLALFRIHSIVELNQFREVTGASRNIAAAVLDSFDALGLTKRTEAGRHLATKKDVKTL